MSIIKWFWKENMHKVSVVMSTYGKSWEHPVYGNLLKRAINSVLSQTFDDFEFILINDASPDDAADVCQDYARHDNRIVFINRTENSNCPAQMYNDAMEMTTTPFITFMFDDDVWYAHALQDLYNAKIKYADCPLVYGQVKYIDDRNNSILYGAFGSTWRLGAMDYTNLLSNNAAIIDKSVLSSVGGFDEDPLLRRLCDWDLWRRIGQKHNVKMFYSLLGECYAFINGSLGTENEEYTFGGKQFNKVWQRMNDNERVLRFKQDYTS